MTWILVASVSQDAVIEVGDLTAFAHTIQPWLGTVTKGVIERLWTKPGIAAKEWVHPDSTIAEVRSIFGKGNLVLWRNTTTLADSMVPRVGNDYVLAKGDVLARISWAGVKPKSTLDCWPTTGTLVRGALVGKRLRSAREVGGGSSMVAWTKGAPNWRSSSDPRVILELGDIVGMAPSDTANTTWSLATTHGGCLITSSSGLKQPLSIIRSNTKMPNAFVWRRSELEFSRAVRPRSIGNIAYSKPLPLP